MLDLTRDCVIGINIFGSCYGSTGPGSIDPATGKPYGPTFPLINVRDLVNAQVKLIDHLGIDCLKLAIGASIGGMQVLEWAILFPERVARAVSIGAAPLGAMGLGLNHLQRQAIMLDPEWRGRPLWARRKGPKGGLALARALGMVSYKSVPLFEERFDRPQATTAYGDENPYLSTSARPGQPSSTSPATSTTRAGLHHRASTPTPTSPSRAPWTSSDPVRAHENPYIAYNRIRAHVTMVVKHLHGLALPTRRRPLARRHDPCPARHPLRLPRRWPPTTATTPSSAEPDQLVRLPHPRL